MEKINENYPIKIPEQYSSFEFVRPISWKDIFSQWRKDETKKGLWEKVWQERGFSSWDEWRSAYIAPIQPESLQWYLYKIKSPLKELPLFFGVPTVSWAKKVYNGEKTKPLRDILDIPIIKENDKVISIKKEFPIEIMLAGLVGDNKIVLVEGMHRACAIASWDPKIPLNSQITITLASWEKEIPTIGGNYKK